MEAAMIDALFFLANLACEVNRKPHMVSKIACGGLVFAATN
jgi:hypothetical protein